MKKKARVRTRKKSVYSPEKWTKAYVEKRPTYQVFTTKVYGLIKDLLKTNDIDVAQIEYRTKTLESFKEKISRGGKSYNNPLVQVTDLSGIRIITYYLEDAEKIGAMLRKEFKIDEANSVDKTEAADPDRFGYVSVHYVISLSTSRKKLTEWRSCASLKAEVQVRTALQHAWAAIDHKLRYKAIQEVPRSLRRQLFRLSALLELADSEFSNLSTRSEELNKKYSSIVEKGEFDIELDSGSLNAYLKSSQQHLEWAKIAVEIGFQRGTYKDIEPAHLSFALKVFGRSEMKTIRDLVTLLDEAKRNWGRDILTRVCKLSSEKGFVPFAVPLDVLSILAIYGKRKTLTSSIIQEYSSELREAIIEAAELKESKPSES